MSLRSEIAWRDAKYAQIYDYLREEYEVAQRFGNLDFKLKFVEVLLPLWAFSMHMLGMVPASYENITLLSERVYGQEVNKKGHIF